MQKAVQKVDNLVRSLVVCLAEQKVWRMVVEKVAWMVLMSVALWALHLAE